MPTMAIDALRSPSCHPMTSRITYLYRHSALCSVSLHYIDSGGRCSIGTPSISVFGMLLFSFEGRVRTTKLSKTRERHLTAYIGTTLFPVITLTFPPSAFAA